MWASSATWSSSSSSNGITLGRAHVEGLLQLRRHRHCWPSRGAQSRATPRSTEPPQHKGRHESRCSCPGSSWSPQVLSSWHLVGDRTSSPRTVDEQRRRRYASIYSRLAEDTSNEDNLKLSDRLFDVSETDVTVPASGAEKHSLE
jgi:hypothetical protein